MPFRSISRFLVIAILSVLVVYHGVVYWSSRDQAIHEIEELFDAQLAHSSNILFNLLGESVSTIDQNNSHLPIVYHGLEEALSSQVDPDDVKALFYQRKIAYQIFNLEGKLLIKSNSAPLQPMAPEDAGFSRTTFEEESWRVFSLYDDDWKFWLHVGESEIIRDELSYNIARQTLLPGVVSLPILILLIIAIVILGLKPLKLLAQRIDERDPKNLSPIELPQVPSEIRPVLTAINQVFSRLQDAIDREKRLTADAAHELRTPLSVIMIHAQNALEAKDDSQRSEALHHLESGIKRISRLLEQLLTLSKINPESIPLEKINLVSIAENVLSEMLPKIEKRQQDIALNCEDRKLFFSGSEFLIEILLRNLVDNAANYTQEHGSIVVSLEKSNKQIEIRVSDNGPGVAKENMHKLKERFYRQDHKQGYGAGLGLSLVQSIVEFHNGSIHFETLSPHGLQVLVRLPYE